MGTDLGITFLERTARTHGPDADKAALELGRFWLCHRGDIEKALPFLNQAAQSEDARIAGPANLYLGSAMSLQDQPQRAEFAYREAECLAREADDYELWEAAHAEIAQIVENRQRLQLGTQAGDASTVQPTGATGLQL